MPLGTFDRTPPPFFRQGLSALTKLVLFSALAIFLMAADNRFTLTQPLRAALATALLPVVRVLAVPVRAWESGHDYLHGLAAAQDSENAMRAKLALQAERSSRVAQLAEENARLRALLELRPALHVAVQAAEVLYEAPDPFSRKLFLDLGASHGVVAGSPVINDAGVLGQVTRVYPLSSEVTLLVDKDAAIPVLNERTEHRSAAFGTGVGGAMELRFMAGNDDVQVGDLLVHGAARRSAARAGAAAAGGPVATAARACGRAWPAIARQPPRGPPMSTQHAGAAP